MIHNSSSDSVLIKKISLKIWSLRDEIESRIQDQLAAGANASELDLMKMRDQYSPKNLQNNVLSLTPDKELDSSEDEMARAMAEVSNEEGGDENSENTELAATPSTIINIDHNTININLEAPNIPEDKISKGKAVLSEIGMDKMFFFCNRPFTEGQSIVIQFCIPKTFIANADILYCRPFNLKSRIISQNNYSYRALIRFNFLKAGERVLLRQFLQSIEPELQKEGKKTENSKTDPDGSDFGELDDLGL